MTDPQTHFATGNLDDMREHKWECAVCGAIGPNPEFDTLDGHAQAKHPEEWKRFVEQGIGEDVPMGPIVGVIGGSIAVAVGVFYLSWSLGIALLSYIGAVVVGYTFMVVTGHV